MIDLKQTFCFILKSIQNFFKKFKINKNNNNNSVHILNSENNSKGTNKLI